jgi:SH3 domain
LEDDDLQSPVVTQTRHRKSKRISKQNGADRDSADFAAHGWNNTTQTLPPTTYAEHPASSSPTHPDEDSEDDEDDEDDDDIHERADQGWDPRAHDSRWSRDYQFTIVSPDEEMHGRAVALFDFHRENENELPLVEGQIVLISYRHGEGWLVAQDPRTQESGLVPEEYVRLLRDIEGGYHGLMNGGAAAAAAAAAHHDGDEVKTPTQESTASASEHPEGQKGHARTGSGATGEYYQPIVSTFSTTREDFQPWPAHKLTSPTGEQPPVKPGTLGKGKEPA